QTLRPHARVVDEDVDPTEAGRYLAHKGADRVVVAAIDGGPKEILLLLRVAPGPGDETGFRAAHRRDAVAALQEARHQRGSEATAASADERYLLLVRHRLRYAHCEVGLDLPKRGINRATGRSMFHGCTA